VLLVLAFAIGMIVGWRRAAHRGGDRLDRLQYGAVHGIAFTLAVLVATVLAERAGLL
jgi:phosphate/sulfate permease